MRGEKKAGWHSGALSALFSRLSFRPLVYGYSNARVRAMRTHLLSRRQAGDLLKVNTSAAIEEYLSRTIYREDFSRLPPGITNEERLEIAVARNFSRTTQKLLRITPKQSKKTLLAFLGRYDIHNLKTILLSRKLGKSPEQTRHLLMPAGSLSVSELSQMLSAKGPEELYEAIRTTKFGSRFLSSASRSRIPRSRVKAAISHSSQDAASLDGLLSELDSYYYEVASYSVNGAEKDAETILSLLRSETDAKNAMTALRLKRTGAERGKTMSCMVKGGSFSRLQLEKMAGARDVAAVSQLASAFFMSKTGRGEFAEAEKRYRQDAQLSHFEVAFENSLARRSLRTLRRSMMSIGAIVGFLFLKEEEMNNIRKIARGKALGLAPEKISEMLVLVG